MINVTIICVVFFLSLGAIHACYSIHIEAVLRVRGVLVLHVIRVRGHHAVAANSFTIIPKVFDGFLMIYFVDFRFYLLAHEFS